MAKIKIVTDSTACLSTEYCRRHDVAVVHLAYTFEGEYAAEGAPEEWDEFYRRFEASKDFPKTSQGLMHGFLHEFERALLKEGYDAVFCAVISAGVSGTYSSACTAAEMIDASRIVVVDSKGGGSSLKMLVEDTVRRREAGAPVERLRQMAEFDIAHTKYQFTVATLEYLKRGGRVSSAMAMLGGVMRILPVIELTDGQLLVSERIRGSERKAVDRMMEKLPERVRRIGVSHVMNLKLAEETAEKLKQRYPQAELEITQVSPVIGCHLGPGALGIAVLFE